jgi:hypothetical protein
MARQRVSRHHQSLTMRSFDRAGLHQQSTTARRLHPYFVAIAPNCQGVLGVGVHRDLVGPTALVSACGGFEHAIPGLPASLRSDIGWLAQLGLQRRELSEQFGLILDTVIPGQPRPPARSAARPWHWSAPRG